MRKIYQWVNGEMKMVSRDTAADLYHAVHGDEIAPTEHPGGGIFTSKSKLRARTRELGWVEVGTESLKNQKRVEPTISQERIYEAFQKAEAITGDPTRLRAWHNEQREKREKLGIQDE